MELRRKVAFFCNVDADSVIQSIDVSTIYEVPILMQKEKLDVTVLKKLGMDYSGTPDLGPWKKFLKRLQNPKYHSKNCAWWENMLNCPMPIFRSMNRLNMPGQ